MDDKLKRFVQGHLQDFEVAHDELKWKNVERRLNSSAPTYLVFWKVAALFFLLTTITLIVFQRKATNDVELSDEFKETETYFTSLILQKKQQLANELPQTDFAKVERDLEEMNQQYQALKMMYTENVSDPQLTDAMIQNLRFRVALLTKQLEILQKIKYHENKYKNDIQS